MKFKLICKYFLLFMIYSSVPLISQAQYSLLELCKESDDIIVAEITQIKSSYNNSNGRITTKISLKIDERIKSNYLKNIQEFELVYPGGEYGDIIQIIPGAPRFKKGEKTILFLKRNNIAQKKFLYVFGLSEGKFNIINDGNGNEYILRDSGNDNLIISTLMKKEIILMNSVERVSKKDFINLIKSLL
ncbi:hypothetical protein ACSSWA_14760 [Melioribacter sp. Ez-97]|uniref:hypothetical protein n=1 Tax=Melioribacter sp. Ez-97 TaxID=3423434 RepID=UPI003EDACD74